MIYPQNTALSEEVETWIDELDRGGPFQPPAQLQQLLDRAPVGVPADLLALVEEVIDVGL